MNTPEGLRDKIDTLRRAATYAEHCMARDNMRFTSIETTGYVEQLRASASAMEELILTRNRLDIAMSAIFEICPHSAGDGAMEVLNAANNAVKRHAAAREELAKQGKWETRCNQEFARAERLEAELAAVKAERDALLPPAPHSVVITQLRERAEKAESALAQAERRGMERAAELLNDAGWVDRSLENWKPGEMKAPYIADAILAEADK